MGAVIRNLAVNLIRKLAALPREYAGDTRYVRPLQAAIKQQRTGACPSVDHTAPWLNVCKLKLATR
jgi:hypothetical protein